MNFSEFYVISASLRQSQGSAKYPLRTKEQINYPARLTRRENEIMALLIAAKTSWEISRILNIRENTVKTYIKNLYSKLGVNNRVSAVIAILAYDEVHKLIQNAGREATKGQGYVLSSPKFAPSIW